jgi:hypothetical protein
MKFLFNNKASPLPNGRGDARSFPKPTALNAYRFVDTLPQDFGQFVLIDRLFMQQNFYQLVQLISGL